MWFTKFRRSKPAFLCHTPPASFASQPGLQAISLNRWLFNAPAFSKVSLDVLQTSTVFNRLYHRRCRFVVQSSIWWKLIPGSTGPIRLSAGVTGLATALRLRQSGHRVTVVDKGIGPSEVCLLHHRSIVIPVLQLHLLRPREKVLLIFHPIPPSFSSNGVLENN
jgi:hypothetical protein